MKKVSNEFINLSKKVKIQDLKLTINEGELTVQEIHLMPVNVFNAISVNKLRERKEVIAKEIKYSFEGQLFKTIMQQIEITVKNAGEIKNKNVNFQYGIQVNNKFEYVDIGEYYIKDIEDDKNKEELVVTGYDKMLNFMIPFKQSDLKLTYPCTISKLVNRMGEVCGVKMHSTNFFNSDLIVDEDFFTVQELTYRDVLEKIAQATLTTIFIKENKLYLCKIGNSVQTLDTSFLSNLIVEEKFGPVNALVLGRGSVEDNIESTNKNSINTYGRCEIRFDENEILDNKREKVIDSMLQQIEGLEYYSFEASNLGLLWLEPCDVINVKDREGNSYKTIYLNANVTVSTGIKGEMEASIPETTTTEYKVTTKEQKKTLKVERLAKKNEGLIQDIIEQNTETTNKLSEHTQTIDSMKDTLKSQETKIETVETKADDAQSTANTANTNAQNAQNTANSNTTKITTTTTKLAEVEKTVDGITQSVSAVEEKVETVETKADTAQSTADTATTKADKAQTTANTATTKANNAQSTADKVNTNLTTNYYTKTETNSQIQTKADSINTSVTKQISTAKTEAINSANTNTDKKLLNYTVTEKLGTFIEQNWEYIKYAWNQISQYLKMEGLDGKATLNIYNSNNKMLMSLSQDGQTFYDSSGNKIGTVGIVRQNSKDTLAFAMNVNWNSVSESKSMAWGYFDKNGNFLPIFHLVGTYGSSSSEYGGKLAVEGSISVDEEVEIIKSGVNFSGNILDGQLGKLSYTDTSGNTVFTIKNKIFNFSNILKSYLNEAGGYTVEIPDTLKTDIALVGQIFGSYAYFDNIPNFNPDILSISGYGGSNGWISMSFKNNTDVYVYANSSDKNLKNNIKQAEINGLDRIKRMNMVQFDWKDTNKHQDIGFIAQEMNEIDENYVHYSKSVNEDGSEKENWQINTLSVLATTVKAIQEQQEQIEELKEENKQKDKIIAEMLTRIENLEKGASE